jgi:hypothetical protein
MDSPRRWAGITGCVLTRIRSGSALRIGRKKLCRRLRTRRVGERQIVVKVLKDGFEYESRHYRSLSAIAREVTGTRWNGLLFFGIAERRNA